MNENPTSMPNSTNLPPASEMEARLYLTLHQAHQLRDMRESPMPGFLSSEALNQQLTAKRLALGGEVLDLLLRWVTAGGSLRLIGPGEAAGDPATSSSRPSEPAVYHAAPPRAPSLGPIASDNDIQTLARHYSAGVTANPYDTGPVAGWADRLTEILTALGPPLDDYEEEERRVRAITGRQSVWKLWPKHVQRLFVAMLTARLRSVQEDIAPYDERLDDCFRALSGFSERERPGFVHGLARGHTARHGSWANDADIYWAEMADMLAEPPPPRQPAEVLLKQLEDLLEDLFDAPDQARDAVFSQVKRALKSTLNEGLRHDDPRLVRLVTPFHDDLDEPAFRRLRRTIRDQIREAKEEADEAAELEESPTPLPEDWPLWSATRGKRAILIGGAPRDAMREALQATYEFSELEWMPAEYRRNQLLALRKHLRNKGTDMLILLGRFIGHNIDHVLRPACEQGNVTWVHVDHGYGPERIRSSIERAMGVTISAPLPDSEG